MDKTPPLRFVNIPAREARLWRAANDRLAFCETPFSQGSDLARRRFCLGVAKTLQTARDMTTRGGEAFADAATSLVRNDNEAPKVDSDMHPATAFALVEAGTAAEADLTDLVPVDRRCSTCFLNDSAVEL